MLKKRYLKSRNAWKVTFELPKSELPKTVRPRKVYLMGEFNDWSPITPMELRQNVFCTTLELEPGREYQFRYLVNGKYWFNDSQADAYVPNGFGDDNCVVITPLP